MESLTNNHAFHDGNKRIGFAVSDVFLRLNGFYLEVEPLDGYRFITASMSKGDFRFGMIRDWISSHLKPL
jgi:death-on-curing protein